MADEEKTQPPHQPTTWRTFLKALWTWGAAHTVASAFIIGALSGFIAGKVL